MLSATQPPGLPTAQPSCLQVIFRNDHLSAYSNQPCLPVQTAGGGGQGVELWVCGGHEGREDRSMALRGWSPHCPPRGLPPSGAQGASALGVAGQASSPHLPPLSRKEKEAQAHCLAVFLSALKTEVGFPSKHLFLS